MTENKIIETLDYLFEKFGIAVDWTTENVLPYVEQLAEKIVTYNIVVEAMWVGASVLGIIVCCIYARILYGSYKLCKTTQKDTLLVSYLPRLECTDFSMVGFGANILVAFIAITSIICLFIDGGDLLKWIFIPELQLIEYVSNLVNNVPM
jgi:hypothetical protein